MPTNPLTVIGDNRTPVDWWFIYKISKGSQSPTGQVATGEEYVYCDSEMAKAGQQPVLSKNAIDRSGALFDTYSQLFTADAKANKDLGYYCYNDEDRFEPPSKSKPEGGGGTGPSPCGHCKGALAFDLGTDSGFWLIHSVPLLPMTAALAYPATGFKEAQTMLCIQLANAAATKPIAQLMYDAHGPNVNVASDLMTVAYDKANNFSNAPVTSVPGKLGYVAGGANNDPRLLLMQNRNGSSGSKPAPYSGRVPLVSKGGQQFLAIAKNRAWGDPAMGQPVKDFYDVLVSTVLNENIDVETWENAGPKVPPEVEAGETHDVENMHSVNFAPLGIPWSWAEENDHAKLCISDRNNAAGSPHWVCVGDINFTDSMEKRGGGTVAFICDPLWQALVQVLSAAEEAGAKAKPVKPVKIPIKGGMKTGTPQTKSVPKKTSSLKTSTRKKSSSRTSGKATSKPATRAAKSKVVVRKRTKAVVRRKGASTT
jgi:deoxyribonuclease-2